MSISLLDDEVYVSQTTEAMLGQVPPEQAVEIPKGFDKFKSLEIETLLTPKERLTLSRSTKKRLKDQVRYKINMRKMMFEDTIDTCEDLVDEYLHTGKLESIESKTKKMNKITEQDVMNVTKEIFNNDYLNFCVIGNHTKQEIERLI